jgi:CubicO group peptidase (beta-lactamase class C family)
VKDAATVSAVEVLRKVPWFVKRDMTSAEYQAEFDARARAGYRLKDVDGYTVGGTTRFVAIWDLTPGVAYRAAHNMTQANFASLFNSNLAEGFRLVRFNGYAVGATEAYAAIWEATVNPPAMSSTVQMTSDQYQAEFNKQLAAGFRLKHVSCYTINGQERYGALFEKVSSPAWSARHLMTATDLTNEIASRKAAGFRIVDVTGCNVGGTDHYAAIFENSALPTFEEHADTGTGFDLRQDDLYRQGAQPATVSGYAPSSGAEKFAAIWQNNTYTQTQLDAIDNLIKSFFTTNPTVPSVSLAISKNERLVYAKAFDSPTLGTQSPLAHVANVYRIASISKPLTGMVIGRMIELGLLSYSSPVFGTNGILGNTYGDFSSNPNVGKITVRHLLNHTSGIPGAADSALIGPQQDVSKTIAQLITAGLNMVPSDAANAPGSKPAVYSNLGYDILARVAEKVGNGGYEILTQANIMLPSGVTAMRIGPETQAARAPNEVTYFPTANHTTPPQDPGPYQLTMRRMDGNGGWIASPIDLLKVTAHNDLQPRVIDILGPQTLSIMSTPPAGAVEAGGWQIFPGMWFHNGNMWGTLTKLTRFDTGFSVATLTNKWVAGDTTNLDKLRDDLMALPALPAGSWTELDLFN